METLTAPGVEYLQGYYVGRPSRQASQIDDGIRRKLKGLTVYESNGKRE